MGTIIAMIIICCLIISAALTVVIILVTIPTEITQQSHYPELWVSRESTRRDTAAATSSSYFQSNEKTSHSFKEDSSVAADVGTTSTNATATPKISTDIADFPSTDEISRSTFESDRPCQSSATLPTKTRKPNSSQRSTTVFLGTNITILREKKITASNRQHNSEPHESTPRNSRRKLPTLMLHQHIEQLPLSGDNLVGGRQEMEQVTQMTLLREMTFPSDVKVVGLAKQSGALYVATNNGRIAVINPENNEQMKTIDVAGRINGMTVTQKVDIVILNGTNLISYRDGKKHREMKLPVVGKSLSAFEDEIGLERILALGGSDDVLFLLTSDLKLIEEIYYKNAAKETCNFAIFHHKYYYISCESAILQLSKEGEITERIGANNGTFSLGIAIDDEARIIAVIRGQPLLRVFQNGRLQRNLSAVSADEASAIWSEVLYEKGRLHVVDYLRSKLKTYRYPVSSTDDDA
ncbi:unnamed protein product [Litomosoides sigmodontis]|uniref:Uncharacterized protein n=1 Tax=Litomosoides sigmodontis TaxID=42156 RepID=A0A3P6TAR3_LITSI|nr:unnamed protein product [Litomosoides sigmodontis]